MAISNFIDRIQIGDAANAGQIAIGSSAYGVCDTIASEAAKTVNIPGFALNTGTTVHIKFTYTNSVASPTLNISNTGAKSIMQYGITNAGTIEETTGWQAGAVLTLTYDGTNWIRDQGYNTKNTYINGTGLSLTDFTFNHSNSVTAQTTQDFYPITIDSEGHIDSYGSALTAATLGLDNATHFIGVVANNSEYMPSNGSTNVPTIVNLSSYTPVTGDIIIDKDLLREYIWVNDAWVLLGFTRSSALDSNNEQESSQAVDVPIWISRVQQATDGTVSIQRQKLGTVPVANGGTGVTSFTNDCVIVSTGTTQSLVSRALKVTQDANDNLILTHNENNKNITINANGSGAININSTTGNLTIQSSDTGAVTLSNTSTGPVTVSSNYGSLILEGTSTNDADAYSILTLGNHVNKNNTNNHSEGKIILYSSATASHNIIGEATDVNYTHTLPKETGWLVSAANGGIGTTGDKIVYVSSSGITTASTAEVGDNTQPVYLTNGTITALTYTANRLYYSYTTSSFVATNHWATATELALNQTTAITSGYTLEVNGKTKLNDDIAISGTVDITGNTNITGDLKVIGSTPKIVFDTSTSNVSDWILVNDSGNISLNNQANTPTEFLGTDTGFQFSHKVYINETLPSPDDNTYQLYVNGSIGIDTGHIIPTNSNHNQSLGSGGNSAQRWASVYIGTADTYGDPYLPIYWYSGVPTNLNGVIQYNSFSFTSDTNGNTVVLQSEAYNDNTYVLQIVVATGEEYLNGPIDWSSSNVLDSNNDPTGIGQITLTTVATSGTVSGYILTSRGCVAPVPSNS